MITICQSLESAHGEHMWQWMATGDGGGHWVCGLSGCGEVEIEGTGHHGG